jgi:beta-lactamase regulating signal transducer with metallopeptidase domain
MIIGWLAYVLFVSALLSASGLAADRALRQLGRPTRWVWVGVLAGPIVVPMAVLLLRYVTTVGAASATSPLKASSSSAANWWSVATERWADTYTAQSALDAPVLLIWTAATALILCTLLLSHRRMQRESVRWKSARLDGHPVRISDGLGPAVIGLLRGQVVLPRWAMDWESSRRRLILLHELEHLKAGDARLLLMGLLVVSAMPWNVFAWWQLRRLRLAVESDCDQRVLRSGAGLREYATALFDAGLAQVGSHSLAGAIVQFESQLGKRVVRMMERPGRRPYTTAILSGLATAAILFVACETPTPTGPETNEAAEVSVDAAVKQWIYFSYHLEIDSSAVIDSMTNDISEYGEAAPFGVHADPYVKIRLQPLIEISEDAHFDGKVILGIPIGHVEEGQLVELTEGIPLQIKEDPKAKLHQ